MNNSLKYAVLLCILCLAGSFLSSCVTSRAAFKHDYDFTGIRTIGMGMFQGGDAGASELVKDAFIRQLIRSGYSVKQTTKDVDVIVRGSITEFLAPQRYLFYTQRDEGSTNINIGPRTLPISGSNVYNLGSAFGLKGDSQIMVSNATAGISAKLVDPETMEIIWSNSYTYEGIDIQAAVEGAVNFLVQSITTRR